jgi:hypothetical protein
MTAHEKQSRGILRDKSWQPVEKVTVPAKIGDWKL